MNKSEILKTLIETAQSHELALHTAYISLVRTVFRHINNYSKEQYITWRKQCMPEMDFEPECHIVWSQDILEHIDSSVLFELGDTCALDQVNTGSYYTPRAIAEFMATESLMQQLLRTNKSLKPVIEKFQAGKSLLKIEAKSLQKAMLDLKILDLACGNGIFLTSCYNCYMRVAEYSIYDVMGTQFINNCLYGVDIRPDALESWSVNVALSYPSFHWDLKFNGICCNSIKDDKILRVPEIKEVLEAGGFNIVIGNPPYIGEKGSRELFMAIKDHSFGQRYYEGKMDLFYFFFHRGLDLLKTGGLLTQLTTSYFITADFSSKLKARLRNEGGFSAAVSFNEQRVFENAKGHHLITFYEKNRAEGPISIIQYAEAVPIKKEPFKNLSFNKKSPLYTVVQLDDRRTVFDHHGNITFCGDLENHEKLKQFESACTGALGELVKINQGIVSGADKDRDKGIFVLEDAEIQPEFERWLVPWFKNSDIKRYSANEQTHRKLLYISNEDEKEVPKAIINHLTSYKDRLCKRRETINGLRPWYGLQWPRNKEIFEGPKIVAPQRSSENRFAYVEGPWYASADVYFITSPMESVSLWALLAYMNSDVVGFWLTHRGKKKGRLLELYATPLKKVPVPIELILEQSPLHTLGIKLYQNTKQTKSDKALRKKVENIIDEYIDQSKVLSRSE